jgi:hypothetical protein
MTRTGQAAIDHANGRIGENVMPAGYCLQFTRECFDVPALYGSAIDAWNGADGRHEGDRNPPPAVPVWFATSSVYDHVCIRTEDAYVVSTFNDDIRRFHDITDIERAFDGSFLGWAESINGVRIYTPKEDDDDMPTPEEFARAVWSYPVTGTPPGSTVQHSDIAAAWLRDARTAPEVHAKLDTNAKAVWSYIVTGTPPGSNEQVADIAAAWLRDARTAPEVHAKLDALTVSGVRYWPSTLALILAVAIIAGLVVALLNKAVNDGVWAGAATLFGGLIGWAASTVTTRMHR